MNFTKIELVGFKSFADKQEIKFDNGVTAIVGPNGCGKSNVADAIRWVLGEQSAKTMRGTSMQDVIFAGTQNRKSLSYCEVSLFFDNTNRIFPDIQYDEVVFTRKLFRSGESEYYINKQQCRMKNIVDALHECGLSKTGYSIIGQGKVTEILSSKPEDRRAIFEEAIGIAKTKAQRQEYQRKLERTQDNLTRHIDIISELERQRTPLEKKAETARICRGLNEQLKYNEVNTYLFKSENAVDVKQKISTKIKMIEGDIKRKQEDLETTTNNYNAHQQEIIDIDGYLKTLNEELIEKAVSNEKLSGDAKVIQEKINFYKLEIDRLYKEIEEAENVNKQYVVEIEQKQSYVKKLKKDVEVLNEESTTINLSLNKIITEISEGEQRSEQARQAIIKSVEGLADIKANMGALSSEKNLITTQQQESLKKVDELISKLAKLGEDLEFHKNKAKQMENDIVKTKQDIKDKEDTLQSSLSYINELNNKIFSLNSMISSLEANKKMLVDLKDNFEGFQHSVKRLLQLGKEQDEVGKRIKGVVANVIKTDEKFAVAIETILGGSAQNIITDNPDDAQYLMNILKRMQAGRCTFLPVTSVKEREESIELALAKREKGYLGTAEELVQYDKYFKPVINFLLGNLIVVDTLENATNIAKKYRFSFRIVTLDGDILSNNGSMSGGSKKQNDVGLLSSDGKIQEIEKKLEDNKLLMDKFNHKKQILNGQCDKLREEINELGNNLQELRQNFAIVNEVANQTNKNIEATKFEIETHKDSIAIINSRISEIEREYDNVSSGSEQLNQQRTMASSSEEEHKSLYDELKKQRDALIERNNKIQVDVTSNLSEITSIESEVDIMQKIMSSNTAKNGKTRTTIDSDNEIIKDLLKKLDNVSLSEAEKQYIDNLKAKLENLENKKKELTNTVVDDDNLRQTLQIDIMELNKKQADEENKMTRVDTELEYLQQRVWEEYQIDYNSALPLKDENFDATEGEREIVRLKREITKLGDVDYASIEEFAILNERYQEKVTQKEDIEKAQKDIQEMIDKMTKEMSAQFETDFEKIRVNFTKVFKELFGGGTADLILDKSLTDDPLEQGIDIVAVPQGKALKNISLLSGGERSLIAIAILFAILRLRPMPFCVLDEIEAALDDANVDRFARYLNKFSEETQFIVITHKKVTMEHAEALFGVTMQEKGVSNIVSVKLSDVKEAQ